MRRPDEALSLLRSAAGCSGSLRHSRHSIRRGGRCPCSSRSAVDGTAAAFRRRRILRHNRGSMRVQRWAARMRLI
jgi:hypothetical protein